MDFDQISTLDKTFRYQLLDRLRSDCDYYLNNGGRQSKQLWAGDEKKQIAYMKAIWESFAENEKPEWLMYAKIIDYEAKMFPQGNQEIGNRVLSSREAVLYLEDPNLIGRANGGFSFVRGKSQSGEEYRLCGKIYPDLPRFYYLETMSDTPEIICGSTDVKSLLNHLKEEFNSDPGMMMMLSRAEQAFVASIDEPESERQCKCKACGTLIDMNNEEALWGHLQLDHEELFEECRGWETPFMIEEYYDTVDTPGIHKQQESAKSSLSSQIQSASARSGASRSTANKPPREPEPEI